MELAEVRFQLLVFFRILTIRCVVELVASHHVVGGDRFEGKLIEERHGQCHEESPSGSTRSSVRRGGQSFHCNELQNRKVSNRKSVSGKPGHHEHERKIGFAKPTIRNY